MTKQVQAPSEGANNPQNRNLYVTVNTYNAEGRPVGTRVVDMYHYGTRNWLQNHHWWAMHNGHLVETQIANETEVAEYVAAAEKSLQAKFNKEPVAA